MAEERALNDLSALELSGRLAAGAMGLSTTIGYFLAAAQASQAELQTFAHLDERVIRLQAEHLEAGRARGEPCGPLYGVPIGIKDIVDTIDFPTEFGSAIHAGRYPIADATLVRRLREAGAVIFGKTTTSEFAIATPSPTRNPHRRDRTPGASSAGSAAAVAAGLVPVAIGSQTNGSMIRPASFCGVYAFKPTRGLVPRTGVLEQSPTLDQMGVFARSIEDLAAVIEVISGDDGVDASTRGIAPRRLLELSRSAPPLEPRFCFVRTPWWSRMSEEAREACDAFVEVMDGVVVRSELPDIVERVVDWHQTINNAELAHCLRNERARSPEAFGPALLERLRLADSIRAIDYLQAVERIPHVTSAFDEYFERFDAILTPASLGAAPPIDASTGDPIMQTVWSFGGLPSVNLPLITLEHNLPMGIQAVGPAGHDGRLLRACRWLVDTFIERTRN
jgi:Asp-tRNA(Asn)/Glu-tRNA(Gln) amidotransferase A subunit family amidase